MSRPVAALSSDLLVRKGMALPLGLQPTEQTPMDVVKAVRPSLALVEPEAAPETPAETARDVTRSKALLWRVTKVWSMSARRWGLPTVLFVAGLAMIAIVAVTGPGTAPSAVISGFHAPTVRPPGPTPITWVDNAVMANPALAGR